MAYTPITDFSAKDSLPSGDAAKVIKGAEFTTEFEAIAQAFIDEKSDTVLTGTTTIAALNATSVTNLIILQGTY